MNIINSSYEIDTIKFSEYCTKSARLHCEKYNWFYMPVSMHKLLLHSSEIISKFLLPIGLCSEEAQESRNKDNKQFRLHHSRKDTRLYTIEDQLHYLLITSDPIISTIIISQDRSKVKTI